MSLTKARHVIRYFLGIPKSIYVNVRLLPIAQAIKLPILVSSKTKLSSLQGKVVLAKVKPGIIRIGFGSIKMLDYRYNRTILHLDGKVIFLGKCKIGQGSRIEVAKKGVLECGHNFIVSGQSQIICHKEVRIGEGCLFAWDSLVMDTDYHHIYDSNHNQINKNKSIIIGSQVWLGTRAMVLKGAKIANGCVVAANAVCTKDYVQDRCILAGSPAKVVKTDITWDE